MVLAWWQTPVIQIGRAWNREDPMPAWAVQRDLYIKKQRTNASEGGEKGEGEGNGGGGGRDRREHFIRNKRSNRNVKGWLQGFLK